MSDHQIRIRAYDAETDLAALSLIWFRASLEAHAFIGEARLSVHRQDVESIYLPKAETWVACIAGRPVGFISLLGNLVGGLFVDPDHQGRGVGAALVRHADALREVLELEVYTENAGALGFYKALGFLEISRRPTDNEGLPFENVMLRRVRA